MSPADRRMRTKPERPRERATRHRGQTPDDPASFRARALVAFLNHGVKPLTRRVMKVSPPNGLKLSTALLKVALLDLRAPRGVHCRIGGVACDVRTPRSGLARRTVLYLHGGGFVVHAPAFYRHWGQYLADRLEADVIIPDYRLAPQHRYPAALDDCHAVYRALLAEGRDPRRMVLMGDSAGGNLVLATLLRLRDGSEPLPACAVPISPALDFRHEGSSMRRNARRDAIVPPEALPGLVRCYADQKDIDHPHASPLKGDLTGLPPMAIFVGGTEVLLDDSRRLAEAARGSGVPAKLHIWPHMPHVFPLFQFLPEARAALEQIAEFVQGHMVGAPETEARRTTCDS
jgi:monoterpene epsilon-lactone hydrolase